RNVPRQINLTDLRDVERGRIARGDDRADRSVDRVRRRHLANHIPAHAKHSIRAHEELRVDCAFVTFDTEISDISENACGRNYVSPLAAAPSSWARVGASIASDATNAAATRNTTGVSRLRTPFDRFNAPRRNAINAQHPAPKNSAAPPPSILWTLDFGR